MFDYAVCDVYDIIYQTIKTRIIFIFYNCLGNMGILKNPYVLSFSLLLLILFAVTVCIICVMGSSNKESFKEGSKELKESNKNKKESLSDRMHCYNFPDDIKCKTKEIFDTKTIDGAEFLPSVDGSNKITSMAMLSHNKCDPKCCPSQFTCGSGCLCLTKKQKCWLNNHGISK